MKTKLLLLMSMLVMCVCAQSTFSFNVSPLNGTAVVDKYAGGYQQLSWPIVVALPPGTAGNTRAYRIVSPANPTSGNPLITFNPSFDVLQPGTADAIAVKVNVDAFVIGQYSLQVFVLDLNTNTSQTAVITLTVADLRTLTIPPATTRTVPHLATGAGWITTLQFTNPSNLPSAIEIDFYSPAGVPTPFRLRDGRYAAVAEEIIPGYGTTSIVLEDTFAKGTLTGTAEIKPLLNNPVGTTIIYQTTDNGTYETGIQATAVTSGLLTLFYDNTNGRSTGVAVLNSLNFPQVLTITYYDDGGDILDTQTLTLPAKGQTSFMASNPKIANRMGVFTVSAPIPTLTGFALRANKNMQFIPVMPF